MHRVLTPLRQFLINVHHLIRAISVDCPLMDPRQYSDKALRRCHIPKTRRYYRLTRLGSKCHNGGVCLVCQKCNDWAHAETREPILREIQWRPRRHTASTS